MRSKSVLVVEDDDNSADLLSTFARSEGFVASIASSLAEARQQLVVHKPGIVLLDLGLPDGSGMDLFSDENLRGDAEIVLITGNASVETSVQALRLGAADYLIKPVSLKLLRTVLTRLADAPPRGASAPALAGAPAEGDAVASSGEGGAAETGADASGRSDNFGGMWGVSRSMRDVFTQIERVARTSVSVFIVGESGTGKELVAESIHRFSHRKNGPFEAVNCGAISAQLIESELFGHEKGSFTGAIKQHKGFFERASGGTLFLDEITEMPLDLQVKLLRVLETGTFSRVGSDSPLRSDVRVVAATNRQPITAVRDGKLREDLYYRLNVFQIGLPPLARAPGGPAADRPPLPGAVCEARGAQAVDHRCSPRRPAFLSLARQRARVAQLHPSHGHHGGRQGDRRRFAAAFRRPERGGRRDGGRTLPGHAGGGSSVRFVGAAGRRASSGCGSGRRHPGG